MTPLEKALEKQNRCNDTTKIGGALYCNKSGKIIHPLFVKNEKGIMMCDIQKCRNRKDGAV